MERRVITTDMMEEDIRIEGSLRPQCLDDYIGQEKAKKNLKIYWSPETQEKVINNFEITNAKGDSTIFAAQTHKKMMKIKE